MQCKVDAVGAITAAQVIVIRIVKQTIFSCSVKKTTRLGAVWVYIYKKACDLYRTVILTNTCYDQWSVCGLVLTQS